MSDNESALLRWAMVKELIREAQSKVKAEILLANSFSKESFSQLESDAYDEMMTTDSVKTEYGIVQKIYGRTKHIEFSSPYTMKQAMRKHKSLILLTNKEDKQ